jgi:serine/threonine protein kinase
MNRRQLIVCIDNGGKVASPVVLVLDLDARVSNHECAETRPPADLILKRLASRLDCRRGGASAANSANRRIRPPPRPAFRTTAMARIGTSAYRTPRRSLGSGTCPSASSRPSGAHDARAGPARPSRASWPAAAIADLGLARAAETASARLTATEHAMGSPFYTAPEQWVDTKRVDERADIFALGKILQALVSGGTPRRRQRPRRGPEARDPHTAISPNPGHRRHGAAQLLTAIQAAIAPAPQGRWESLAERERRLRQRLNTFLDMEAVNEIADWAYKVDSWDYTDG